MRAMRSAAEGWRVGYAQCCGPMSVGSVLGQVSRARNVWLGKGGKVRRERWLQKCVEGVVKGGVCGWWLPGGVGERLEGKVEGLWLEVGVGKMVKGGV